MKPRAAALAERLRESNGAKLAAFALVGVAVWASSFAGRFQYDDLAAVVDAQAIDAERMPLAAALRGIRPLTAVLFRVENGLFGFEPFGYHFSSVALHFASSLLVWQIARRLRAARADAGWAPGGTALLFLVHPLATEAVTYLSGRASLLAGCLSLLSVERWLAWRERSMRGAGESRPWASLAAFALALLAKETAAIVPLALVLVDAATGRPPATFASRSREHLPHLLVLTVFFAAAATHPVYRRLIAHSLALRGPIENLLLLPAVALESALLYVAPWRSNLDHDLYALEARGSGSALALALGLVALAAWAVRHRRSAAGFGTLWFLLHLLPTSSLVARNDVLSERNLYLPSFGLALATAALGRVIARSISAGKPAARARLAVGVVAAAVIVALGVGTVRRNDLYADPVALWRDTVRKSPGKARPHANLGWSLYVAGETDLALDELRLALRLAPGTTAYREALARVWERKRRETSAAEPGAHVSAPDSPPAE